MARKFFTKDVLDRDEKILRAYEEIEMEVSKFERLHPGAKTKFLQSNAGEHTRITAIVTYEPSPKRNLVINIWANGAIDV